MAIICLVVYVYYSIAVDSQFCYKFRQHTSANIRVQNKKEIGSSSSKSISKQLIFSLYSQIICREVSSFVYRSMSTAARKYFIAHAWVITFLVTIIQYLNSNEQNLQPVSSCQQWIFSIYVGLLEQHLASVINRNSNWYTKTFVAALVVTDLYDWWIYQSRNDLFRVCENNPSSTKFIRFPRERLAKETRDNGFQDIKEWPLPFNILKNSRWLSRF